MEMTLSRKSKQNNLPAPDYLECDALAIWDQVVDHLATTGELLAVDAATIETFVLAVIRQRRMSVELAQSRLLDDDGKPHPLLRTIEATAATVKNLGHVLKLNPTARKGSQKSTNGSTGVWDGVLT